MRFAFRRMVFGVILSALPIPYVLASHETAPPVQSLPVPYVKRLLDEGEPLIFVDLRPADEFRRERLPKARSLPLMEILRRYAEVPRTGRVILYCDCLPEQIQMAYRFLRDQGYRNISVMQDGFSGWVKRGYPVER